jgi:adenylate cyclase class 2
MSFEVEQKYRTADHRGVAARLTALGAEQGAVRPQEDIYLSHPSRDFGMTQEAFRVRRSGKRNALTYKGPRRAAPTKTREEVEIPFARGADSLAQMRRLLEALGFRTFGVIRKVRTPYRLSWRGYNAEVTLDQVEGLGTFVEVEVIAAEESDLTEVQAAVLDLAGELGLTEVEPRSYLRMWMDTRGPA